MAHTIITIGRQYGSGGREIGKRVAASLGCAFYDNELLALAAERASLHPDIAAAAEERPTSGLLYGAHIGVRGASAGVSHTPLGDRLFHAQSEIIRQIADAEDCVIIGRCADYILRGHEGLLSAFVYADTDTRIARCLRYYGIDEETARQRIKKIDRQRAGYYTCYSDKPWGDPSGYDLMLDCGRFGADGCAELIIEASRITRP